MRVKFQKCSCVNKRIEKYGFFTEKLCTTILFDVSYKKVHSVKAAELIISFKTRHY